MNFEKNALKAIQHDSVRAGFKLTLKQIAQFLEEDKTDNAKWLEDDCKECTFTGEYGLDTMARDVWFDVLSNRFGGRSWPLNGEGDSTEFFKTMAKNAKKAGVKLITQ